MTVFPEDNKYPVEEWDIVQDAAKKADYSGLSKLTFVHGQKERYQGNPHERRPEKLSGAREKE
jgi:hypothetical protein